MWQISTPNGAGPYKTALIAALHHQLRSAAVDNTAVDNTAVDNTAVDVATKKVYCGAATRLGAAQRVN